MSQQGAHSAEAEDIRLAALGSFIWSDRALLLATAARSGAGGHETLVECKLRGASMADAIPAGSRVRIACGQLEPRNGDVVAFSIDERIVVHRVVYRRRRGVTATFLARGDARVVPDPPLTTNVLIGRVLEYDAGRGWQPVGAPGWTPRLQRLFGYALFAASVLLLELNPGIARRFIGRLDWVALRMP